MSFLNDRLIRWITNGLAGIVLILAIVITFASVQNRSLQDKVNAGRADLAKAQTLTTLDSNLIQLLAKTAAEKNDSALQALLARNGVTFQIQPTPAAHGDTVSAPNAGAAQ